MGADDRGPTDVLVVGAGPVGLTLANDLAARGVSFRIIDPLPEPRIRSKAHGMHSRSLEALDRLGLAEPLVAASVRPVPSVFQHFDGHLVAQVDQERYRHEPFPYQLIIMQQTVERVLEQALEGRGRAVERQRELVAFEMDDDHVTAKVSRGDGSTETISARWIVGCDGAHSTVRKGIGLDFAGRTIPFLGWFAECDLDWKLSRDIWWVWRTRAGALVGAIYVPFTGKWHLTLSAPELAGEEPDLDRFAELMRKYTGQDVQLSDPLWIEAMEGVNQRMPDSFIAGRAILAGDAAHVHTAASGQGMNTGIQDALALGWRLALSLDGAAAPTLLQTYDEERVANARALLKRTGRLHQWVQTPRNAGQRLLSKAFWKASMAIPAVGRTSARRLGMLDLNYAGSSLTEQATRRVAPRARAGWHAPDAPCRAGGRPATVFELLRGPVAHLLVYTGLDPTGSVMARARELDTRLARWAPHVRTLLVLPGDGYAGELGLDETDERVVIDGARKIRRAFGLSGPEVVYIRPDGYIGLRTPDLDEATVSTYLRRVYLGDGAIDSEL